MNNTKLQNWFLHIDLDAFFASVEQLDNPQYRGLPVIVGGRKDDKRGIVSTASYEARKFGVHSAMPIFQAVRLCPNGIYLRARMKRYAELSYEIMTIFKDFSPDVEQMSIDEAFIDLTGTEKLFGPPEETAFKIKARVKEQTGLTVSIGLATTKYLAKIASGYSKPDGFYFIKPGEEQKFMLTLPLKKVWGVGPKALERLKRAGLNTTKDIYEKPLELLNFLFGNTMGTFLYNVVRGEEKEVFSRKPKSHSISAENTFSEDITDIYTAETALLELSHGVMFRLLKEEKYSRTATVKIKYDDFTSVSIQKTLENNIITLDKFYETIKTLFEEKYQNGRGIRLLGVGFDKVEIEDRPIQQSLFENDNKEDKKQAVEKAILNLNKKHPEIKIQKARLLKSLAIIFIMIYQLFSSIDIYAEDIPEPLLDEGQNNVKNIEESEDKGTIFNWDINDKTKVDFKISGNWNGEMLGSFISTFNKDKPAFFDAPIPVFKQDIELSSLFTLNKKWYFEANFADNFSNNTLSIGYKGDKYFRSGKLSNRNITMPDNYSSEQLGYGLSGGKNQAPGISAHWQSPSDKWSSDLLIRYDMTSPKSATFYGMNKVTDVILDPKDYLNSFSFTFPQTSKIELNNIKDIYIETDNGNYQDENGRLFKKLSSSDFYYSSQNNILYLSPSLTKDIQTSIPTILITFIQPSFVEKIIADTGNYSDINSFKGEIQTLFNKSDKKYNLEDFSYPLATSIENKSALIIQSPEGFSPYIIANTYDCGTNQNIEISVISKNSKNIHKDYIAEIENTSYITPYEDFFDKKHTFAKINKKDSVNSRFPFAEINPQIYLNINSETDIALQTRTYNKINKINIGEKASAGTISVLKNGSYISDFIYNANTGDIILSEQINNNDQIKIIWEEETDNFAKGTLSIGLGYQFKILPELNWDIALTAKKPFTFDNSIPTPENIKSSFIALSTGLNYKKNNFSVYDKVAFALKKQNNANKLLISTEGNFSPETFQHKINSAEITKADLFVNNNIFYQSDNYTIKSHEGEKDTKINGYRLPLQWDFSKNKKNNISWAAMDIKLEGGNKLKNSSKLKFYLCLPEKLQDAKKNYRFYVQIGIDAGAAYSIKSKNIPTFDITDKLNFNTLDWQNIELNISEKDRAYLVSNSDIRFIVIKNPNINEVDNLKGKIYIGPYTTVIQSIFTKADENILIHTTSIPSSEDYFSSEINWNILNSSAVINNIITAEKYFTPIDFTQYKTINIKFAYENRSSEITTKQTDFPELSITFDTDNNNNSNIRNIAIQLELYNISQYLGKIKNYHNIYIKKDSNTQLSEYSVYIDNIKLNNSDYKLYINNDIVPSRVKYNINTISNNKLITSGSFYVDNIIFEESDFTYSIDNIINSNYKKDNILTIKNYPILTNGFIKTESSQRFSEDNITVLSYLTSGITITGLSLQADMLLKNINFQNAGHNVKTVSPILNIFSFDESYRWNNHEASLQKSDNFGFSLASYNIPINLESKLSAKEDIIQKEQNHSTVLSSNFNIKNNNYNFASSLSTNQKINVLKNNEFNENVTNNYFKSWFNISKLQFSTGNTLASSRTTSLSNNFLININDNFITPSINYTLSSFYENITAPTFEDRTTLSISVPLTLEKNFISFNLARIGGNILNTNPVTTKTENAYFSDINKLFNLQPERKWFYTSIPFYELFDQNMSSKIKGDYSSKYEINYSKQLYNSFKDLYIPSSASLAIIRDIKSKDNFNFSDSYQIKASITSQSINNFGKNSEKQFFKWFNQEEITSNITAIVKIPVDNTENTTYKITSYIQLLLMIKDNSIFNSFFDFSIETKLNWHTKATFTYTRPGKTCLMSEIVSLFSEKIKNTDFDISRKDSFSVSIGTTNKINRQQYNYNHSVEMGFLKYFTITNSIGTTLNYIEDSSSQLSINYSIGGKVSF